MDKTAFILWAESYPYNEESPEIKALSFLPDHVHMATKIITRVLWSMVYVIKGGSLPCPDGLAHGLHVVDPILQQPPESIFPIQINFDEDLRNRARERWEETLLWVQYWWKAGYTLRNPTLFYSRNLRMDSPMVLFVLYHINKVLPEGKPIRMEAVMANTRWDYARMALQEADPAEVHRQLEKEFLMEEVNKPAHEYLHEHAAESVTRNYELLREVVRDADRHREKAIQKDTQVQEQRRHKERRQKQMDLALHAHNHQKDKEHATAAAAAKAHDKEVRPPPAVPLHLPPQEKTLTTMMPPSPVPSVPVSICHPEGTPLRTSSSQT